MLRFVKLSHIKPLTENYFDVGFVRFLDKITNEKKSISFLRRGKQRLSNELQPQFTCLLKRGFNGFILFWVLIYNKLLPKISKPAYTAAISLLSNFCFDAQFVRHVSDWYLMQTYAWVISLESDLMTSFVLTIQVKSKNISMLSISIVSYHLLHKFANYSNTLSRLLIRSFLSKTRWFYLLLGQMMIWCSGLHLHLFQPSHPLH